MLPYTCMAKWAIMAVAANFLASLPLLETLGPFGGASHAEFARTWFMTSAACAVLYGTMFA